MPRPITCRQRVTLKNKEIHRNQEKHIQRVSLNHQTNQIRIQAIKETARKNTAFFLYLVANLRLFFILRKRFSTKCRSLQIFLSIGRGFLAVMRLGIKTMPPRSSTHRTNLLLSYPLSAIISLSRSSKGSNSSCARQMSLRLPLDRIKCRGLPSPSTTA